MSETHPLGVEVMSVSQDVRPCELHAFHSPVTVVNELHHAFPQEWQNDLWGEIRDKTLVSVCSTSHNTVHAALRYYDKTGTWPDYCIGRTRDLAQYAIDARAGRPVSWQ